MNKMTTLSAVSFLTLIGMPLAEVSVGSPAARPLAEGVSLVTCWYNEKGEFTSSGPAAMGASSGTTTQTAASGPHAWSYTIAGHDQSVCPAKLPVSSMTPHQ
jgi:hypothetical protein